MTIGSIGGIQRTAFVLGFSRILAPPVGLGSDPVSYELKDYFFFAPACIKASIDNSTWFTVDTVSLSTGSSLGKFYSDANKATTIPVDPVAFPYLNITLPAIASRVQTITWSGIR